MAPTSITRSAGREPPRRLRQTQLFPAVLEKRSEAGSEVNTPRVDLREVNDEPTVDSRVPCAWRLTAAISSVSVMSRVSMSS
jgi:hypothetical protein